MKVVYVGTDLDFDPNPGKTVHTIFGMKRGCCDKCQLIIDVGKRDSNTKSISRCRDCGDVEWTNVFWKNAKDFRPVQDQYTSEEIEAVNIDELTEVLNEPVEV